MTTPQFILAILWNVFVIPGSGQMYLKHKKRGWIFVSITLLVLLVFFIQFMAVVQQYLKNVVLTPDDLSHLWEFSQNISRGILQKEWGMMKIYTLMLMSCYAASVFDIFYLKFSSREGRKPV